MHRLEAWKGGLEWAKLEWQRALRGRPTTSRGATGSPMSNPVLLGLLFECNGQSPHQKSHQEIISFDTFLSRNWWFLDVSNVLTCRSIDFFASGRGGEPRRDKTLEVGRKAFDKVFMIRRDVAWLCLKHVSNVWRCFLRCFGAVFRVKCRSKIPKHHPEPCWWQPLRLGGRGRGLVFRKSKLPRWALIWLLQTIG